MARPFLFTLVDTTDERGWNFLRSKKSTIASGIGGTGMGAPDLIPFTQFNPQAPQRSQIQVIDVVNDFEWTHTPAMGRHEVPFIRLSEYRINFNSLIQNIKYQLAIAGDVTNIDSLKGFSVTNLVGPGQEAVDPNDETAKNKRAEAAKKSKRANDQKAGIKESFGALATDAAIPSYLKPYWGLYGASPSGFEYYFPYFNQQWKQTGSKFGDTEGGGIFAPILSIFGKEGTVGTLTDSLMVDQNVLGAYIERPKMYTYDTDGPSLTFSTVLLNTKDQDEVIRNWHLAFMLAYQNLPNRTSKVFLEPPVIYEVEVPGTFYTPFAYIESLRIVNRGATRVMKIPYYNLMQKAEELNSGSAALNFKDQAAWDMFTSDRAALKTMSESLWNTKVKAELDNGGVGSPKYLETIIPDAYQIDITIKSLLPESKNLFFHSALGSNTLGAGIYSATIKQDPKSAFAQTPSYEKDEANRK